MSKEESKKSAEETGNSNLSADKLKALRATMDKIEKNYGKGSIMKLGDEKIEDIDVIPSGSIALNAALGVGGHLTALRREAVGPFALAAATPLDALEDGFAPLPLGAVAPALFPVVRLPAEAAARLAHGQRVPAHLPDQINQNGARCILIDPEPAGRSAASLPDRDQNGARCILIDRSGGRPDRPVAALGPDGALVAIARRDAEGWLAPEAVFA
jgi:hypothetical protein